MKIEIRHHFSGAVICTAEVECDPDASESANLRGADLAGAYLSGADLSGEDLSGANLSGAYLRDADLRFANLSGAYLRGADLRFANLSRANLSDADLSGANLSDADLSSADITDASFDIDGVPVIPDIHSLVYEAASQDGALDMSNWHCGTAHCRAGWVVTLAGEAGKKLEDKIGTPAAAALIYMASDPKIDRIPDFYCSNEKALEDMKRLAEQEDA